MFNLDTYKVNNRVEFRTANNSIFVQPRARFKAAFVPGMRHDTAMGIATRCVEQLLAYNHHLGILYPVLFVKLHGYLEKEIVLRYIDYILFFILGVVICKKVDILKQ